MSKSPHFGSEKRKYHILRAGWPVFGILMIRCTSILPDIFFATKKGKWGKHVKAAQPDQNMHKVAPKDKLHLQSSLILTLFVSVFFNSTNASTNIETAMLSTLL